MYLSRYIVSLYSGCLKGIIQGSIFYEVFLKKYTIESKARYQFKGDELYVRVRIATTLGHGLWTQPIVLDDLEKQKEWINNYDVSLH